jgi:hypothetical protein
VLKTLILVERKWAWHWWLLIVPLSIVLFMSLLIFEIEERFEGVLSIIFVVFQVKAQVSGLLPRSGHSTLLDLFTLAVMCFVFLVACASTETGLAAARMGGSLQEGQARLIAAWLAGSHPSQVAERNWQRRKKAVLFLVGSKFRPMQRDAAAAKPAQEQVDKHAKLPGIPRRSKEENLAYLHKEVFGHEGIQRCLVGML